MFIDFSFIGPNDLDEEAAPAQVLRLQLVNALLHG